MSFIANNLAYYRNALEDLEQQPVTLARIYRAKQLLKFVDDIVDEG